VAAELEVIDVLWSVASAFVFVDPMINRALTVRCARLALRAGEPRRIAVALGCEATNRAFVGETARVVADRLCARSLEVAGSSGSAYALGYAHGAAGMTSFLRGDFPEALAAFERGVEVLRSEATDARWEIDVGEIYRAVSLLWLGRLRELDAIASRLLAEAHQSGDQYLTIGLRAWRTNLLWLVRDQPADARRFVEEAQAITQRHSQAFGLFEFLYTLALGNIDLYEGAPEAAWQRIDGIWGALRRTRLTGVESVDTEACGLRLRAALALAPHVGRDDRRSLLAVAARMAGSLRGSRMRSALGALGTAMVEHVRDGAVPAERIDRALAELDAASLHLCAASGWPGPTRSPRCWCPCAASTGSGRGAVTCRPSAGSAGVRRGRAVVTRGWAAARRLQLGQSRGRWPSALQGTRHDQAPHSRHPRRFTPRRRRRLRRSRAPRRRRPDRAASSAPRR
jgi:hypothetical protein